MENCAREGLMPWYDKNVCTLLPAASILPYQWGMLTSYYLFGYLVGLAPALIGRIKFPT